MAQEGKGNGGAGSQPRQASADVAAGRGVPTLPGQQLSCPRELLCYVF